MSGDHDLLVRARGVLLTALEALAAHRDSVVVIGAQAIYLHTGAARVALAEATKDSDLALDARTLGPVPRVEEAMRLAGFRLDETRPQPGTWLSQDGVPVDLMVPETVAGKGGRRGARVPPHSPNAMRRAAGLEAAVVDHLPMLIRPLDPADSRVCSANVAGPAALLVAKLHKVGERQATPTRLVDKDAHDIYRLLVATSTEVMTHRLGMLEGDALAGPATRQALAYLADMFGRAGSVGAVMAGRAEEGIGTPAVVAASVSALAQDILGGLPVR